VRQEIEALNEVFRGVNLRDFWDSLTTEEKSYLYQHIAEGSKQALTVGGGSSENWGAFLGATPCTFLANFVSEHSVYHLKTRPDLLAKFEKQLSLVGGDYFVCSSKIKDLIRDGKAADAKALFYGPFMNRLFSNFIQKQLKDYGKWDIRSSEGWESFINYLIMSGRYREAESLIQGLADRFHNRTFQSWVKTPLSWIRTMESKVNALVAKLKQGEEIIQSSYYSANPEDGYLVINSAMQQGLVEKQRFKRSFRIVLRE
jgi:hypothetical protein